MAEIPSDISLEERNIVITQDTQLEQPQTAIDTTCTQSTLEWTENFRISFLTTLVALGCGFAAKEALASDNIAMAQIYAFGLLSAGGYAAYDAIRSFQASREKRALATRGKAQRMLNQ